MQFQHQRLFTCKNKKVTKHTITNSKPIILLYLWTINHTQGMFPISSHPLFQCQWHCLPKFFFLMYSISIFLLIFASTILAFYKSLQASPVLTFSFLSQLVSFKNNRIMCSEQSIQRKARNNWDSAVFSILLEQNTLSPHSQSSHGTYGDIKPISSCLGFLLCSILEQMQQCFNPQCADLP